MGNQSQRLHCPTDVAKLVPESLARQFEFFPLGWTHGRFTIAVGAPFTDDDRDAIEFVLKGEVCEVVHPPKLIQASLDELYGPWVGGEESIYYWREWHDVREDGTIVMKTRGYTEFGGHWTGWTETAPTDMDYPLWNWICSQGDRLDKIISGQALEAIREEYRRHAELDQH